MTGPWKILGTPSLTSRLARQLALGQRRDDASLSCVKAWANSATPPSRRYNSVQSDGARGGIRRPDGNRIPFKPCPREIAVPRCKRLALEPGDRMSTLPP
jgi:hypothetical protein